MFWLNGVSCAPHANWEARCDVDFCCVRSSSRSFWLQNPCGRRTVNNTLAEQALDHWFGGTWSRAFGERIGLGISTFFAIRSQTARFRKSSRRFVRTHDRSWLSVTELNDIWIRPTGRLQKFRHALSGVSLVLRTQPNAWIHAGATVVVVAMGIGFEVTAFEWTCLVLATMAVWTAEGINTALELLGDALSPDFHPLVGKAKDVAAGAVLMAAVGAAVVGLLILGPYVLGFF